MVFMQEEDIAMRRGISLIYLHQESVHLRDQKLDYSKSVSATPLFLPISVILTDYEVEHIVSSEKVVIGQNIVVEERKAFYYCP